MEFHLIVSLRDFRYWKM